MRSLLPHYVLKNIHLLPKQCCTDRKKRIASRSFSPFPSFCSIILLFFLSFCVSTPTEANTKKKKAPSKGMKKKARTQGTKKTSSSEKASALPSLERKKPFRSPLCLELFKDAREDIKRYRLLLPRIASYRCEQEISRWRACQSDSETTACQKEETKKLWYACFRILRRMRVMTMRLEAAQARQKKESCRWQLELPEERYIEVLFSPPPTPDKES
jgi:hypothetical protein